MAKDNRFVVVRVTCRVTAMSRSAAKLAGVRAFVAAQRQAAVLRHQPGHLHRRLPLRGAGRWGDAVADEPLAAFHQDMPLVAKLGPVTVFFQNAPGLSVRRRGTGTVTTPLPTQSDGRIPGIVGRRAAHPGRALEPLAARPRFDQDTVDGEVFTGQQMLGAGPRHDVLEERAGRLAAQPSPLSGDLRGARDRVVHGPTHELAKEQFAISTAHRAASRSDRYTGPGPTRTAAPSGEQSMGIRSARTAVRRTATSLGPPHRPSGPSRAADDST
jgi:hypothetical protein